MEIMKDYMVTIVFHTQDRHRGWSVTRAFNDKLHMDNFIKHIERTKHGFKYDEHYKPLIHSK